MLGSLARFLFGFGLVAGAVFAVYAGIGATRADRVSGWLGALGGLVAVVVLAGVANPAAAFPAFLVWPLAASVALIHRAPQARQPKDARPGA